MPPAELLHLDWQIPGYTYYVLYVLLREIDGRVALGWLKVGRVLANNFCDRQTTQPAE